MVSPPRWLGVLVGCAILAGACSGATGDNAPSGEANAATSTAESEVAGVVDIGSGRTIYRECRGSGSPTVVLVSGALGAHDDWTYAGDPAHPQPSPTAVFDQVARFTRSCVYDRPGTTTFSGAPNRSSPVAQPTTAQNGAADLNALLAASPEPQPYVLVGASWGGLIVQQYAREHPDQVAGIVLVDAASPFLKETLTAAQWANWVQKVLASSSGKDAEVPDYEASVRALQGAALGPTVPAVVLTSDQQWDLQVGGGSTWPAWIAAQDRLATALGATHVTQTNSGHAINIERPQLAVDAISTVVTAARMRR